jgi:hypothetical protein
VIIDAHAHAARDYATVKSILETARKYEIENIPYSCIRMTMKRAV